MKSLVLAFVCFLMVLAGCYDVQPFKAPRRVLRRTPKPEAPPAKPMGSLYRDYADPQSPVRRPNY